MSKIVLTNVDKFYGKNHVLKNLNLTIEDGDFMTLLGPSGCGKTTTLRVVSGLEKPQHGFIHMDDKEIVNAAEAYFAPPSKRNLNLVFQSYALWPHMTVFDNVAFGLKIRKESSDVIAKKVASALERMQIGEYAKRYPTELSGGQQQRVAIARAIVSEPRLLLLDEPLSNLDANLREEMRFEIKALQRKFGITVLFVTHDQEVALAISDRLAIMDANGKIRQIGNPYEIFEKPADLFVFKFMGIANFLHVTERNGKFYVGTGNQEIPWEGPKGKAANWVAGFRPSDVEIHREGPGLKGIIHRANFLGATMDYAIDVDDEALRTEIETHTAINNNLMFKEGEECYITFKALHWFDAEQLKEVEE